MTAGVENLPAPECCEMCGSSLYAASDDARPADASFELLCRLSDLAEHNPTALRVLLLRVRYVDAPWTEIADKCEVHRNTARVAVQRLAEQSPEIGKLLVSLASHRSPNKLDGEEIPSSSVPGVSWDRRRCKWEAFVYRDKKRVRLGRFDLEEDAATAVMQEKVGWRGAPIGTSEP